ncbi:MAG TPA: helix-turn-helix domain-containing protein [Gemmatimonadaceae bacterium]|nr:helix-turn-helix domain-containing protein [Gemmatimonadaceae bacterium]
MERLLGAAERVLESGGLDGATVPAIARRAGMSVGNVYKRFPDKDALLRAVYERFFAEALASNEFALDPAKWEGIPTTEVVSTLVTGMIEGYRSRRSLIRGLLLYAHAHPDARFRARAEDLRLRSLGLFERLLRDRREDIGHPQPERAIRFVVMLIARALENAVMSNEGGGISSGDFLSHVPETAGELSRIVIGYLRVRGTERPRALSQARR